MKKVFAILCLILFAQTAFAGTWVQGYYRKDGTYVAPHYRQSSYKNTIKSVKTGTYGSKSTAKRTKVYSKSLNSQF